MNKLLLQSIKWTAGIWRAIGANPDHLYHILEAKLKMDSRRRSSFGAMGNRRKKESKNQDLLTMFIFFIMGLFMSFILGLLPHTASALALYFTAWMVFVALTMITDFTDVLIDVRDNYILFPRPINNKTLTVSRLLHIGFYLSKLVLAFGISAIVVMTYKHGIVGFLLFSVLMLISVIMAILFVNITYLLILQLTSPNKFKEIITYIQIVFTSMIMIGYYLLPQMIDFEDYTNLNLLNEVVACLLPSTWLGAVWELLVTGVYTNSVIIMAILAIIAPFLSIYFIANYLAVNFNQKMLSIGQGSSSKEENKEKITEQRNSWKERTAKWLVKDKLELSGYNWTWSITARSRTFKVKLYPLFAFIPAYFVYLFVQGKGTLSEKFEEMIAGNGYIVLLYFTLLILLGAFNNTRFSDQHKAAWVYYALPIPKVGPLITGAFKACMVRFYIPFYVLISVAVLVLWGWDSILDITLAFINNITIGLLLSYISSRNLPFSVPWENANKGSNVTQAFLMMIVGGIIGVIHYYLISQFIWLYILSFVLSIVISYLVYRAYFNLEWGQLKEV